MRVRLLTQEESTDLMTARKVCCAADDNIEETYSAERRRERNAMPLMTARRMCYATEDGEVCS